MLKLRNVINSVIRCIIVDQPKQLKKFKRKFDKIGNSVKTAVKNKSEKIKENVEEVAASTKDNEMGKKILDALTLMLIL